MVNFLDKFASRRQGSGKAGKALQVHSKGQSTPALRSENVGKAYTYSAPQTSGIPNASIVYGLASVVLLVLAIFAIFVHGNWGTGLIMLLAAGALFGYAVYFMRYQSPQ